jgi:hypothetical protein
LLSPVDCRYLNQNFFRRSLCVFDEYVKVAVVIEYSRVYEFIFKLVLAPPTVFFDELRVRISFLGIFVQVLHV